MKRPRIAIRDTHDLWLDRMDRDLGRPFEHRPAAFGHRAEMLASAAFVAEVVLTFMFLIVILGSTDKRAPKGLAPIAIGLCLTLIHLISIPVTNTSVNPARSTSQAIFVGGGTNDARLLEAAYAALPAGGRLVANAVTLESETEFFRWFKQLGGELTRIEIAHANALGSFQAWRPALPITQWSITKR